MLRTLNFKEKQNKIINTIFLISSLLIIFLPFFQFIMKLLALCEIFFFYVMMKDFFKYGFFNSIRSASAGKKKKVFLIGLLFTFVMMVLLIKMKCTVYKKMFQLFICVLIMLFTGVFATYMSFFVWGKKIEQIFLLLMVTIGFSFM